jgi:hypothetical protein
LERITLCIVSLAAFHIQWLFKHEPIVKLSIWIGRLSFIFPCKNILR